MSVKRDDLLYTFNPSDVKDEIIAFIKNNLGFSRDARVESFVDRDVLFLVESEKRLYVVKVLTPREHAITNYLLKSVDSICAEYLALPIEIREGVLKKGRKKFSVMVSPVFVTPEIHEKLREDRVQVFNKGIHPDDYVAINPLIPKIKKLMLFRASMGIFCVHQQGIIHGDIKNDNFFGGDVLLGDFGLSYRKGLTGNRVVNFESMPPYVPDFEHGKYIQERINQSADIWGLGMMALQWHTTEEQLPWDDLYGFAFGENSKSNPTTFYTLFLNEYANFIKDPELKDLLKRIFANTRHLNSTFTMKDVLLHRYFTELGEDPTYSKDYKAAIEYIKNSSPPIPIESEYRQRSASVTARAPPGGPRSDSSRLNRIPITSQTLTFEQTQKRMESASRNRNKHVTKDSTRLTEYPFLKLGVLYRTSLRPSD